MGTEGKSLDWNQYWGVHVCGGEMGRVLKKSAITVHLSLGKKLGELN